MLETQSQILSTIKSDIFKIKYRKRPHRKPGQCFGLRRRKTVHPERLVDLLQQAQPKRKGDFKERGKWL